MRLSSDSFSHLGNGKRSAKKRKRLRGLTGCDHRKFKVYCLIGENRRMEVGFVQWTREAAISIDRKLRRRRGRFRGRSAKGRGLLRLRSTPNELTIRSTPRYPDDSTLPSHHSLLVISREPPSAAALARALSQTSPLPKRLYFRNCQIYRNVNFLATQ